MSDTPRTDAEATRTDGDLPHMNGYVDADFARQLERDLAAAQERIRKSEADIAAMTTYAKTQQDRALAAEARAEAAEKDAERYRYIKDDRRGKFVEALALRDAENWDAAIDAAIADGEKP